MKVTTITPHISFDLSGLHSTGLEQESYGEHDIKHHHKRPRAKACSSTCNSWCFQERHLDIDTAANKTQYITIPNTTSVQK